MTKEGTLIARLSKFPTSLGQRGRQTGRVVRGIVGRRDAVVVLGVVTVLYLFAFLYMIRDVVVQTNAGYSVLLVDTPLETMIESAPGAFLHRPVALLELWVVVWEFSPLNILLGLGLAVLVGLNLTASYLAVTQPKSCGLSASSGLVASVPALLAGSACCAPAVVLVLGLQMSGALITAFTWLLPVSISLLVLTLVYISGKINPEVLPG